MSLSYPRARFEMIAIRIVCLGLFALFVLIAAGRANECLAQTAKNPALTIDPDQQYRFAENYFNRNDYFRAVAEYERFIHFFPDDPRVMKARYRIGLSLFQLKRYREAIDTFSGIIDRENRSELAIRSYFRMSECFLALEDSGSALSILDHLAKTASRSLVADEARYRAGWIYLEQDRVEKAREWFGRISDENQERFRMEIIAEALSRESLYPRKDPSTAGALSIIPGAGFLYCERYQDALVAFCLNSALIWAAITSFDNGNPALGGVVAFVGAGFYAGNIYGAVSSAHKYNRASQGRFLRDLKSRARVTLSLTEDSRGVFLALRYKF